MEFFVYFGVAAVMILLFSSKARNYVKTKINSFKAKGSAFVKIAEADVMELEAKGRIIAIDEANKAKRKVTDFLHSEAARVHADADAVKAEFDAVLSKL